MAPPTTISIRRNRMQPLKIKIKIKNYIALLQYLQHNGFVVNKQYYSITYVAIFSIQLDYQSN
jgi:hypothetical protein